MYANKIFFDYWKWTLHFKALATSDAIRTMQDGLQKNSHQTDDEKTIRGRTDPVWRSPDR
jgi:hypothetical protein